MNRDFLRTLLGDAATDDVLDSIMRANGDDVNREKAAKAATDAQLAEMTAQMTELQKAADDKLSDQEKWQKALDEANGKAEKALRDLNEQTAATVFASAGMTEEQYRPFIGSVSAGSREQAEATAKAIAEVVTSKAKDAADAAKKEALAGMQPPAGGEPGGAVTTKAQFRAMSDAEQIRWKSENPEAWKNLS